MNNNRETEQKGQIPSLDNKKDKVGLAKNEIRVALIIILLSIIVVIEALQMPVPRSWNSAPGLFSFCFRGKFNCDVCYSNIWYFEGKQTDQHF